MKPSLKPGLKHQLRFTVTDRQTVPNFYPESPMFAKMPAVLATGYMVGLFEWCCTNCSMGISMPAKAASGCT